MKFKEIWDLKTAMQILGDATADPETWAEAVEWLMLYGPTSIKEMLLHASLTATTSTFPDLKPSHFTSDGQPCYNVSELARHLGIGEEEAQAILKKKEQEHNVQEFFNEEAQDNSVH